MNVNGEHNKNAATKLPMPASCDRLDSWKQIAVYLGREVRTVQRWEKCEDLPVRRHIHLKGGTVYAFKNEIDAWLTSKGQKPSESRPIQKRCGQTVNAFNPPPHVMKQMLSAFRLWLAFEVRESCRGRGNLAVPDVRLVPHDPNIFTERLKSRRNVRRRQLESPSRCRALSLRVEMTLEAYKDEDDDVPLELFPAGEPRWLGVEIRGQAPQSRTLLLSVRTLSRRLTLRNCQESPSPISCSPRVWESKGHSGTVSIRGPIDPYGSTAEADQHEQHNDPSKPPPLGPCYCPAHSVALTANQIVLVQQDDTGAGLMTTSPQNNALAGKSVGVPASRTVCPDEASAPMATVWPASPTLLLASTMACRLRAMNAMLSMLLVVLSGCSGRM